MINQGCYEITLSATPSHPALVVMNVIIKSNNEQIKIAITTAISKSQAFSINENLLDGSKLYRTVTDYVANQADI